MPEVSIILPYKNSENFLEESIESIRAQSFKDWELILVNNGSGDSSAAIAHKQKGIDPRIISTEFKHGAVAAAFNDAFHRCSSPYVARMDSDDIAFPTRIQEQLDMLKAMESPGACYASVKPLGNTSFGWLRYLVWQNSMKTPKQIEENRFVEMPVCNPTLMAARSAFLKAGLFREDVYPEDYEFFLRMLSKGIPIEKSSRPQLCWRDHGQRLTRTHEGYSRENFFKVKADYLYEFSKVNNPDHPEINIWGTGKLGRRYMEILETRGFLFKEFFDLNPGEFARGKIKGYTSIRKGPLLISLVSNRGAGQKIRDYLINREFIPQQDFVIAG